MKARIDYKKVPEALRGMYQLEHYIHNSGLEESSISAAPLDRSANFPLPIHLLESSKSRSSRVLTWNSQAVILRFS
jgi:hypothetical protein